MTFVNAWAFWLLVPVALLAFAAGRRQEASHAPLHSRIVLSSASGSRLLHAARIIALVLMTVALARPVSVSYSTMEADRYEPVYLALDLSASMRAADRKPSRLEYSKEVIEELLQKDTKHPFGLFGFTTNALILSPATMDHTLVKTALDSINPDFIITHGTDIGALIQRVARMPEKRKRLVIFSDGGDGHDMRSMVETCRKAGIRVFAVAAATKSGATIPKSDGGFVRDEEGRLVISMQNPSLAQLAEATGGAVIDAAAPSEAAEKLMQAIGEDDPISTAAVEVNRVELFWLPLLAALLFYLFSVLEFPGRLKKVLASFAVLAGISQADAGFLELWRLQKAYEAYGHGDFNRSLAYFKSVKEPSLQRSFAEASALYQTGAYKKSARILSSLMSDDPAVKSAIYYDLGNCAVRIKRYESARDFYVKSLQLRPDEDAFANLAAILFVEERKEKKPKPAANRQVKASGKSGGSKKNESGRKRESKASGGAQEGGGAQKGGGRSAKAAAPSGLKYPIGSKAYDLINKGYIDERRPW
ncbi:VWA domain-containing protein [Hydrogenimonas sp.]